MNSDFDTWVGSLGLDEPDEFGHVGRPPPGRMEFFRETFDANGGPVPLSALKEAWKQREIELAEHAAALVIADLRRTTELNPNIEVRSLDFDGLAVTAVTYDDNFKTPVLFSIRNPEATCEVADNLLDHIMMDLCSPWPTCPTHGGVVDPRPLNGEAVWFCPRGNHVLSAIGALPKMNSDKS